jgi:hypothetical protein
MKKLTTHQKSEAIHCLIQHVDRIIKEKTCVQPVHKSSKLLILNEILSSIKTNITGNEKSI